MKIAISGTHGTGKTYMVYELAKKYKLKYPDKEISVITEVARKCQYPINEKTTIEAQQWMLSTQIKMEMDEQLSSDIIICDRSIADYLAYAKTVSEKFYDCLLPYLNFYIKTYDLIIFKTIKNNDYLIDDGVRSINPEFRKKVENNLINIYYNEVDSLNKFEIV